MGTTVQKMKFSVKDFSSKCDQSHRKLRNRSHLLKKSLLGNLIFLELKEKGIFPLSNNYLDDVFYMKIFSRFGKKHNQKCTLTEYFIFLAFFQVAYPR